MTIAKEDVPLLRPWLVKRSGELSEADPEVLADYIIALLNNRVEGAEMVNLLKSELEDFSDKNEQFATEITEALSTRSFVKDDAQTKKLLDPEERKRIIRERAIELSKEVYKPDRTTYRAAPPDFKSKINRQNRKPFEKPRGHPSIAESEAHRQKQKAELDSLVDAENAPNNRGRVIIVSNLPADKLDDDTLRSYFSRFGEIETIKIKPATRLAELQFKEHKAAKFAWSSPTPIFDNRFIKVFFKKSSGTDDDETEEGSTAPAPEPFDEEAFKLKQIEKQKEFEARQEQKKIFNAKLEQLIQLKEKMLSDFELKLKDLETQLINNPELEPTIKVKLEEIQKQMVEHGVTPELIAQDKAKLEGKPQQTSFRGGIRGRGGFRGSYRGGARGGKSLPYQRPQGLSTAQKSRKLDLRTRTVTLKNFTDVNNETLQNLLKEINVDSQIESTSVKDNNNLNITFKERYLAERFYRTELKVDGYEGGIAKEWDESVRPVISAESTTDGTSSDVSASSNQVEHSQGVDESKDVEVGL